MIIRHKPFVYSRMFHLNYSSFPPKTLIDASRNARSMSLSENLSLIRCSDFIPKIISRFARLTVSTLKPLCSLTSYHRPLTANYTVTVRKKTPPQFLRGHRCIYSLGLWFDRIRSHTWVWPELELSYFGYGVVVGGVLPAPLRFAESARFDNFCLTLVFSLVRL